MAADLMAIAGVAPAQAAGPGAAASSAGAPDGGEGFADMIAAAMADAPSTETPVTADPAVGAPLGELGIDVSGLLAALGGTPDVDADAPVAMGDGSRLDRDAEAEGLQGALASMLLGVVMRPVLAPPLQAMPGLAAPVVADVATPGVAAGPALAGIDAADAVQVQVQGSTRAAVIDAIDVPAVEAGIALAGFEAVADGSAYVAPVLAAAAAPEARSSAPVGVGDGVSFDASGPAAALAARVTSGTPGDALGSSAQFGATVTAAADADASPEATQTAQAEQEAGANIVPAPTVAAPLPAATAAAQTTVRSIELNEVAPTERRGDDRVSVVPGAGGSQPAPLATPQIAAAAPEVIAATDGQSLASAVANSVQLATLRGDREMTLALNPPDLGHLTVEITGDAAGGMRIAIHASSSEAHDLLQQHLPTLLSNLEQRDVRVERLEVDQQAPSAGRDWTDGGGRESRGRRDSSDDGQPQWSPLAALRRGAEDASSRVAGTAARSSAVDVRA